MKKYKRLLALLLALTMVFCLCACGGEGTKKKQESNGGDKASANKLITEEPIDESLKMDRPITITFYHTMSTRLQSVLETAIVDFNKNYPNITVNHQYMGTYDDLRNQINTEIAMGKQPDLAYCYADHVAEYRISNAVRPLDDYIVSKNWGLTQEQISDFVPAFYNEGKAFGDDKMYTLPVSKSTDVMYYNKTFFDTYNLTVPTTWDEMEEVCKKIKQIDPKSIPLGYDSEGNWFITMCEQYGSDYTSATGEHYLFDNETNRGFVERFRQWYANGWVTTQKLYGGYTSELFTALSDTRCYMSIGSSGGATYQQPVDVDGVYAFDVGIASVPQVDAADPKAVSQGPSVCIFRNKDPHQELAAWLFAKHLATDPVFQTQLSMSNGYMPVIESVSTNPVFAAYLRGANTANIQAYATSVALSQTAAYFVSPVFSGSAEAREQVAQLMSNCLAMTGSDVASKIKKAFADAVAACKE